MTSSWLCTINSCFPVNGGGVFAAFAQFLLDTTLALSPKEALTNLCLERFGKIVEVTDSDVSDVLAVALASSPDISRLAEPTDALASYAENVGVMQVH